MKKRLIYIIFALTSLTAHAELPSTVAEALKKSGIPQENVAIVVQSVDNSNASLMHNGNKSLNPASVMKLVTSNAALDLLTPAYRWKTEIYQDGVVTNGVLNGNLIIKGYGDPNFKVQDFWRLLMSLQQSGIKEIKGDLIIDKSYFSKNVAGKNSFDNQVWRAYNATPSAFLVNGRNTSFKFTVVPNTSNKGQVDIVQEFALPELEIINNIRLVPGSCNDWRNHISYNVNVEEKNGIEIGKSVTFSGTFSPDCAQKYLELSVFNDDQYAFYTFKKLWADLGGKFSGQLKTQDMTTSAVKVLEQLSSPLSDVIREMNKWSNNLMARQLLLTLAAEKIAIPATEANGAIAIKNWLSNKPFKVDNLKLDELVIENGSGLSRTERINALLLSQMLFSAYHSPIMPEFMSSLPILALDGTIMKRLKDSPAANRAHLKTGSLDGVSAIAGYILDKQNKRQIIVMIVNHEKASASKTAQDALIDWVYSQP